MNWKYLTIIVLAFNCLESAKLINHIAIDLLVKEILIWR
jgi:hypothetical protein